MNTQIIRILFYNTILAGLGTYIIRKFFDTQYNSLVLLVLLVGLVVFDSLFDKKNFGAYGIKLPTKENLKLAVIIFSIFFPLSIATRVLFPNFDAEYAMPLGLNYPNLLQFLIFLVPVGIFTEEIAMRSLFQSKLSSNFNSRFAIYATIINFAFLHFTWAFVVNLTNFTIIMSTVFFYSIFLVLLFDYTKNIFSTIIVNLLVNIFSALQIVFHIYNQFSLLVTLRCIIALNLFKVNYL